MVRRLERTTQSTKRGKKDIRRDHDDRARDARRGGQGAHGGGRVDDVRLDAGSRSGPGADGIVGGLGAATLAAGDGHERRGRAVGGEGVWLAKKR